eukprot:CAMPEP_0119537956 /NCGR_PEP_ID=MMETSP1344-20130328/50501_1 /TAXON_ID=236787 /ORGANISM="Florenciella parvula, Strain CCMP2471" /LENGTH=103 /DNA_ID=CAMNT_0007580663 /DNA_START=319 /DNA_END=626 /DNA_ORIENTATION=+
MNVMHATHFTVTPSSRSPKGAYPYRPLITIGGPNINITSHATSRLVAVIVFSFRATAANALLSRQLSDPAGTFSCSRTTGSPERHAIRLVHPEISDIGGERSG